MRIAIGIDEGGRRMGIERAGPVHAIVRRREQRRIAADQPAAPIDAVMDDRPGPAAQQFDRQRDDPALQIRRAVIGETQRPDRTDQDAIDRIRLGIVRGPERDRGEQDHERGQRHHDRAGQPAAQRSLPCHHRPDPVTPARSCSPARAPCGSRDRRAAACAASGRHGLPAHWGRPRRRN